MHRSWSAIALVAALATTHAAVAQTNAESRDASVAAAEAPVSTPTVTASESTAAEAKASESEKPAAAQGGQQPDIATPAPSASPPSPPAAETATPATPPPAAATAATPAPVAPVAAEPATAPAPAASTAATPVRDPLRAALQTAIAALPAAAAGDREDRTALVAFYEARGHAPFWTASGKGLTAAAGAALELIRDADDWGLKAAAFDLPETTAAGADEQLAMSEVKLTAAVLKYARHARGGRLDPATQLSRNLDRKPKTVAPAAVLDGLVKAGDLAAYLKGLHPQHTQFERLRQKYATARRGTTAADKALAQRLLVNMEQWRWMPDDLGRFNVWVNIPEYTIRVMRDGQAVHTERVIVGKADTQTPVFSDEMEQVIFHPFWGVPESIKTKEILPSLLKGQSTLARHNLRIQYRGRDIDPTTVDWTQTDIRNFHVYQPPGGGNVLGVVKFRFPNKHDVYMHDTPSKGLFNSAVRTFSHGCMRVRNPVRLAELILAEDKSWPASRVAASISSSQQDQQVNLTTRFPVHITYFTAWVEDDGKLRTFADIYGHESRVTYGLEGKFHLIPKQIEPTRAAPIARLVEIRQPAGSRDWMKNVFNNN